MDVTLGKRLALRRPGNHPDRKQRRCLRLAEVAVAPGATSVPAVPVGGRRICCFHSLVEGEPKHWKASSDHLWRRDKNKDFPPSTAARTALVFIASHTGQPGEACRRGRRRLGSGSFQPTGGRDTPAGCGRAVAQGVLARRRPMRSSPIRSRPTARIGRRTCLLNLDAAAVTICCPICLSWSPAAPLSRTGSP